MIMPHRTIPLTAILLLTTICSAPSNAEEDLFPQVAQLLEQKCFECHNAVEHKGDFALHSQAALFESGFVEPGKPEESYLLEVVSPHQGKRPSMPKDREPLTSPQRDLLRRWVTAGAKWPKDRELKEPQVADLNWWSLRPLQPPPVPQNATAKNPIDAFLLRKLRENDLGPSPTAPRRVLIRRLYFDLIGLPPTPAEVEAFVVDADPLAYSKLVDRLLASPHYGERWARHWMDVAHYADTHGYDKDKPRPNAWPYRDYLIRAFNDDKPYARFVEEQIAGDALWPTPDGAVATGFLAAGPWDFIGHAEVPESKTDGKVARNLDRDDMVASTLNTFCSLTVQCARCHNHKLDPVTSEDYYRLQAVFAAIDRADRNYDVDPAVADRRADLARQLQAAQSQLAAINAKVEAAKSPELRAIESQIATVKKQIAEAGKPAKSSPAVLGYHSAIATTATDAKWVQLDLGRSIAMDEVIIAPSHEWGWNDFGFPVRFKLEVSKEPDFAKPILAADHTQADFPRPGASVVRLPAKARGRYLRLTATRLWSRRHHGKPLTNDWIFAIAEMAVVAQGKSIRPVQVTAFDSIEAKPRWSKANLTDGKDGLGASLEIAFGKATALTQELNALKDKQRKLFDTLDPTLRKQHADATTLVTSITTSVGKLPPPQRVYVGMVHHGSGAFRGRGGLGPRAIHVLHRGEVSQPGKPVGPGVVRLIPGVAGEFDLPPDHEESARRVALAKWITRADNPLTWRSIANRVWQYHFGQGLVGSPNDFGRGGLQPSHPALLDYLACEVRRSQSIKSLHRLICNSNAYQQTSRTMPKQRSAVKVDSDNRWLWRMNRRRLTAEEIRDAMLHAAGRLNLRRGGPGFQDFVIEQPQHSPHYEYGKYNVDDANTHRRAVYRFIVRSQPQPLMTALDCADPSMSVARRDETLTPLQALALLNNRFVVSMSEHFAARLTAGAEDRPDQFRLGFQSCTGRDPSPEELSALVEYAQTHGLANACRVLFNLNEFVFID